MDIEPSGENSQEPGCAPFNEAQQASGILSFMRLASFIGIRFVLGDHQVLPDTSEL